ncbi:small nuclear ribonucleoprotein SmD3b [Gossypium hirsutum]|uniref:Small nuclear ribonucleoprotein SmD3b n=1 Tax=Gossypium hirsutum TaxID=3635 RepID=A0ABM2YVF0_GOSHI|nr:small nuclear ribonucleoprotein SmD3b-like [Gossypium hirsutum]
MSRSLGIPVKLLHEASGHVVTVELKSGELYRGSMVECEITGIASSRTSPTPLKLSLRILGKRWMSFWGLKIEYVSQQFLIAKLRWKISQLEHVFIRGSKVRFMVIPDMLKNAPMFKRLDAKIKGKSSSLGVGRGRAVAMRAKAQAAGRGTTGGRGVVPSVRR